ncbi:MAG: tRNA 2-thiocytidine biosynthesis TtcA family protein, partial [Clostridia bacterium]
MIEDGDKIAVGVSGGKDSLTLLALLKAYQRFSPHKFDLIGVTIDIGLKENAYLPVSEYCEQLEIPYIVEKTEIGKIVFDERKEKNPCSLCSKMRRGALNNKLNELGYNKLALGHHRDDVVETFLLSLIHEGRLSTFAPISYMSRSKITLIRPMIYIEERDIIPFASTLPVVVNTCPANKHTEREAMKDLLKDLRHNYHD